MHSVASRVSCRQRRVDCDCGCKLRVDHSIMPVVLYPAAISIIISRIGTDGRTPHKKRTGKEFNLLLPEIGECIQHLKPQSVGRDKLNTRWQGRVFAGLRLQSGEIYVRTEQGAVKGITFTRRPGKGRCNQEEFNAMQGVPWQPIPARKGIKSKARFQF